MVLNDLSWPWHTIKGSGQGSHPALRRPTGRNISYLVLLEDVAVSFTASTWCIRSSADLQGVQVHPVWSKGGLWMTDISKRTPHKRPALQRSTANDKCCKLSFRFQCAICQALALGITGCTIEIFRHDHIVPHVTLGTFMSGELTAKE